MCVCVCSRSRLCKISYFASYYYFIRINFPIHRVCVSLVLFHICLVLSAAFLSIVSGFVRSVYTHFSFIRRVRLLVVCFFFNFAPIAPPTLSLNERDNQLCMFFRAFFHSLFLHSVFSASRLFLLHFPFLLLSCVVHSSKLRLPEENNCREKKAANLHPSV